MKVKVDSEHVMKDKRAFHKSYERMSSIVNTTNIVYILDVMKFKIILLGKVNNITL